MYLLLSILSAAILGYLLLMMGPLLGGLIAFGIIAGTLFRAVYLLNKIYKTLPEPPDKAAAAYQEYLRDKDSYQNYLKEKEDASQD
jgi:large-conductance mechanosensitive channel